MSSPNTAETQSTTYFPMGRQVEGAPAGIGYEGDFHYVGTPQDFMEQTSHSEPGDLMEIMWINSTRQEVAARKEIEALTGLDDEQKKELTTFMESRIRATTRLGVNCLEAAGVERNPTSGITLYHYRGGPLVTDISGTIFRKPNKGE